MKNILIIPRDGGQTASTSQASAPAAAAPITLVDRLRARESYLKAHEVAEILALRAKDVYALPMTRISTGKVGERGLRWDPNEVASYLDARSTTPGPATTHPHTRTTSGASADVG